MRNPIGTHERAIRTAADQAHREQIEMAMIEREQALGDIRLMRIIEAIEDAYFPDVHSVAVYASALTPLNNLTKTIHLEGMWTLDMIQVTPVTPAGFGLATITLSGMTYPYTLLGNTSEIHPGTLFSGTRYFDYSVTNADAYIRLNFKKYNAQQQRRIWEGGLNGRNP